jgi:hypothetical protein
MHVLLLYILLFTQSHDSSGHTFVVWPLELLSAMQFLLLSIGFAGSLLPWTAPLQFVPSSGPSGSAMNLGDILWRFPVWLAKARQLSIFVLDGA